MSKTISCGGVVIRKGKILVLYSNYKNKYKGWVLPKGTVEDGEDYEHTAMREVLEEAGVEAQIIDYIGESHYTFSVGKKRVEKEVHWYVMKSDSYFTRPQREEYFEDAGYYKFHEAVHLLKFATERDILKNGYAKYLEMNENGLW